jgi:hypothetical protein
MTLNEVFDNEGEKVPDDKQNDYAQLFIRYLLAALYPMQLPDVDEAVIDAAKFARKYLTADLGSPTSRTTPSE